ncbi:MAG: polysaccharide biosynthesis tyrosine autokinase [Bacteroidaceae bacterium]|nr:polysaccharide biosynthesis tyrosine autokinase [Bacteroidaceae bacterium]
MQENDNLKATAVEEEGFSVKKMLSYLLGHWKMFLFSIIVCVAVAVVYLRYAVPQYQVASTILLQDSEKGSVSSSADMLADFGFQAQNTNVENEIEVIKSMAVISEAVFQSELYTAYLIPGITDQPIYKSESPVKVVFSPDSNGRTVKDSIANLQDPLYIKFAFDGNNGVKAAYSCESVEELSSVENAKEITSFPDTLKTPLGTVVVNKNMELEEAVGELLVVVTPLEGVARSYKSALSLAPVSKTSSAVVMTMNTPVPDEGVDFLNSVISSYNMVTNEKKRQVARQTEEFIIERIDSLSVELQKMETRLADYKKKNQLVDPKIHAPQVSQDKALRTKQLEEIDLKLKSSKALRDFVGNSKNDKKVVPSTFGLDVDQSLVSLINNYNKEVLEYNALVLSVTSDNPKLKVAETRVEQMQQDLRKAIVSFDDALQIQREAVKALLDSYTTRYEQSPDIERELVTLERESKIKADLYVMLLQKYEENALSLAITTSNLDCIDNPICVGKVAPKGKMILLVALFIGLLIPSLIIYIRESMRTELTPNDDISVLTPLPCVGTIPVSRSVKSKRTSIVVRSNKNDIMVEAFRTLRTNLQFVMKKSSGKVIMFTSTTSGEGKTFVASNLAVSAAILGKKVLLMGMDIRRPRLAEVFGFEPSLEGITSYLAADEKFTNILDEHIIPSGIDANLDLLPAGVVPPNPAELLSRHNLEKAIEHLCQKYDYIVMDTAPVGLVTDSMIISRVVDSVVYVARYDYTQKADIKYLNSLVTEGKLANVSVVLNGEDTKKKMYGYVRSRRGSNAYVGYGYVDNDNKKK